MNTKFLLLTSLIVGVLTALLSSIPLVSAVNCLLCGWFWLGGIFGVWLYRNFTKETLTTGKAALMGVVAGLIAAVLATLIGLAFSGNTMPISPEQMQQLEEALGEQAAQIFADPTTLTLIGAVFSLILYPLFTAIGGMIGAAIFKPKQPTL